MNSQLLKFRVLHSPMEVHQAIYPRASWILKSLVEAPSDLAGVLWIRHPKKTADNLPLVGWKSWARAGTFFFWFRPQLNFLHMLTMMFKIISTPTQLSAYANDELKNWYYLVKIARRQTARAKYWSCAYAQLERNIEKTAQSQITHTYHE